MSAPAHFGRAVLGCGFALALAWPAFSAAHAAPGSDEILFASPDLRIYRTFDRHGNPTIVLTNLDDEGNFLDPRTAREEAPAARPPAPRERPVPPADTAARGDDEWTGKPSAGPVQVVVRGGGAGRPVDYGEVEVTTDAGGGTTIVININNNLPPPAAVPAVYPILSYGGLPGAFRYPEHQHFLGYGHGTGSPSLFSGLGLNAGNRFGLKTGNPCGRGFDCMFGPEAAHP
ncbi:MAG: hypothetical protein HY510_07005 [Acidobacteria bacterium]|nr:hypothetical protein [Acidobacteriota bacterium]